MGKLLTDILAFCEKAPMAETTFGREAMNDSAFVNKLRKGRRCFQETEARARGFMADYEKSDGG
jgi:hypothetical protein